MSIHCAMLKVEPLVSAIAVNDPSYNDPFTGQVDPFALGGLPSTDHEVDFSNGPDEIELIRLMLHASVSQEGWCGARNTLDLAEAVGVSEYRLRGLLVIWAQRGWWEGGYEPFSGLFTANARREVLL